MKTATRKTPQRQTRINQNTNKIPSMVVVGEDHKNFINEIVKDFNLKNTREAVELLLSVAEDSRYLKEGTKTRDLFQEEADKINVNRESVRNAERIQRLKAEIAELEKIDKK